MALFSSENKKLLPLLGVFAAVVVLAILLGLYGPGIGTGKSVEARVAEIEQRGLNVSQSLFTPEETEQLAAEARERLRVIASGENTTILYVEDTARKVARLRDFRSALALFEVLDTMGTSDLFYKVDVGNIYLELQQWENARLVFETMKVTWPVHEAYIGLATAYKHIDGTPQYVIDQIYEESLFRHRYEFAVLEEYVKWLEATDREEQTIQYYEIMNEKVPQQAIADKIAALKAKYK